MKTDTRPIFKHKFQIQHASNIFPEINYKFR